ncbi:hypothetical protein DRQ18_03985, partial [bacterium]
MREEKPLKKKKTSLKFQTVREQAHFLKWLDGRLCARNNGVYSVLTEIKEGEVTRTEIKVTPEIFVNTDKAIKILGGYPELTPKLYGKDFLETKTRRYGEIKKFLNLHILKEGFDALDFKTLLLLTPHLHPPPDAIIKKVKKEGVPEINLREIPLKSKELYYYLEGCVGKHRENSRANYLGIKFSFFKDPVLLIELSKYVRKERLGKVVKVLNKDDGFLHEVIWEMIYRGISREKIEFLIDNMEMFKDAFLFSSYLPFLDIKVIKRIAEMNKF